MWVALAVATLLTHLVAHEAAHALVLRRLGGDIKEAGLGLPFPPRIRVKVPSGRADGRRLVVSLSPWLLGAYVVPDDDSVRLTETAPYRERAWFLGAGVVANLVLTNVALVAIAAMNGAWWSAAAVAGATALLWAGRKLLTAYMPWLGVPVLALLAWLMARSFGQPAGPAATAELLSRADGPQSVLVLSAAVGLSLALFNCVPVYPFDGGRVMDAVLQGRFGQKVSERFRGATAAVAVGFILYTLVSDLL